MGIIVWILFGAFIGWIASLIMKTDSQQGAILNIIIGIVGAIVGGLVMKFFGQDTGGDVSFYGFFVALMGAIILIATVKVLRRV